VAPAHDQRVVDGHLWGRSWEEIARGIDLPRRGLREVTSLRQTLDCLERELVVAARRNGSTWQEVGGALGISRQAAHARHRPFVNHADGDSPRPSR
jgi:hypothetical protein